MDIVQLIGSLGFPIVACGALFWKLNKDETMHKEETDKLANVIDANTKAITVLSERVNELNE